MFQAIYVTDASHALTYEYLVFPHSPAFADVGATIATKIGTLSAAANKQIQHIPLNLEYYLCAYTTTSIALCMLCLIEDKEKPGNPLYPGVFLQKLVLAAQEYFGVPLAPTKLSANSDTFTLLINEMIVNGVPNVTEVNNLKDIVLLKSLLNTIIRTGNKLATAAANNSLSSLSTVQGGSFVSEKDTVPWRRSNVKYAVNEMFVDVEETVHAVLRPTRRKNKLKLLSSSNFDSAFYSSSSLPASTKLTPITSTITGNINFLSHITGVPQLQILFNSAALNMEAILLHECVNAGIWKTSRALSFIPPDKLSTLLSYTIDLDKSQGSLQNSTPGLLEFDCETGLGASQNEFEFRLFTLKDQAVSKIDSVKVEVFSFQPFLDEDQGDDHSVNESFDSQANAITDIKVSRVTDGDFTYKGNGKGEWTIKNLQSGAHSTLRASIRTASDLLSDVSLVNSNDDLLEVQSAVKPNRAPIIPTHFQVTYLYKGLVPSGLKVDSLKMISVKGLGDGVKPYKGVKYITKTDDFTIRTR
ncbi:hypothetical protein PUMCH_002296 [Australozyma saopauloensis]|uniref:MHD domain-containing protein n=1 Tax=Australozyma saopauloensis TaxID=291208 RepID=A0AAX4H933_9ASCO|nr:hypothetical protein PUMCH_002296 [[Candida] saopauloensis]